MSFRHRFKIIHSDLEYNYYTLKKDLTALTGSDLVRSYNLGTGQGLLTMFHRSHFMETPANYTRAQKIAYVCIAES